jgi:hypothetical protein
MPQEKNPENSELRKRKISPHPAFSQHNFLKLPDMILPFKQSVQDFVLHGRQKKLSQGRFVCPTAKEAPDLCVYENIALLGFDVHPRRVRLLL